MRTSSVVPSGRRGVARLAAVVAVVLGLLGASAVTAQAAGTWSPAGTLTVPRSGHTATLLPDGRVLVAGGTLVSSVTRAAELYDPATGTWSPAASMLTARAYHTATLLPDGRVLVAGGSSGSGWLAAAELYDPSTNTWTAAASLALARYYHTASLLPNGKVLVAGGSGAQLSLTSATERAELYDPATDTWSPAASMDVRRYYHSAVSLADGRVLVTGGFAGQGITDTAEIYDPSADAWSPAASMTTTRYGQSSTLLQDGKVLVVGRYSGTDTTATAEIYDPAVDAWSPAASPGAPARSFHTATLLKDGTVLITGGFTGTGAGEVTASAAVYDPATDAWTPAPDMSASRYTHTATLLRDGTVLVVGGQTGFGAAPLTSAQLYLPSPADTTAPSSSASAPVLVNTASVAVGYTAEDPSPSSGLERVELWRKGPGDSAFAKVATDGSPSSAGSFTGVALDQGDGDYAWYTIAVDVAGNREAAPTTADATIRRDTTPPTVTCQSPAPAFVLRQSGATVSATASDAGSPPATLLPASPQAADTTLASARSVSFLATDQAGNRSAVTVCRYTVGFRFVGFFAPLPKQAVKGGSTLPVKFALADAHDVRISDAEAARLVDSRGCAIRVRLTIPADYTAPGCPTYDAESDRFQYDLKTTAAMRGANRLSIEVVAGPFVLTTSPSEPVAIR